jgi:hypothetical protein
MAGYVFSLCFLPCGGCHARWPYPFLPGLSDVLLPRHEDLFEGGDDVAGLVSDGTGGGARQHWWGEQLRGTQVVVEHP